MDSFKIQVPKGEAREFTIDVPFGYECIWDKSRKNTIKVVKKSDQNYILKPLYTAEDYFDDNEWDGDIPGQFRHGY